MVEVLTLVVTAVAVVATATGLAAGIGWTTGRTLETRVVGVTEVVVATGAGVAGLEVVVVAVEFEAEGS